MTPPEPAPATLERTPGFRSRPHASHVIFDFDGTVSLLRANWAAIMLDVFRHHLPPTAGATAAAIERQSLEDIWSLNGRPSIHQMRRLAQRVQERGVQPQAAAWYDQQYQARLSERTAVRLAALQAGTPADAFLVPGVRSMLEGLRARGLTLHLVSGTLEREVRAEAEVLQVARYFDGRIHGPADGSGRFSKGERIDAILAEHRVDGECLIAFGDGVSEIGETRRVGGLAVAVASDETGGRGVDDAKRTLLIAQGACAVIPHYHPAEPLIAVLLGESPVDNAAGRHSS